VEEALRRAAFFRRKMRDAVEAAAEEHVRADAQWRERYEELEKENAALRRAQKTAHST
jgi:hypothetical protein